MSHLLFKQCAINSPIGVPSLQKNLFASLSSTKYVTDTEPPETM